MLVASNQRVQTDKDQLNTSRKKLKLLNLDKSLMTRLGFLYHTINQLEEYVLVQLNDIKLASRIRELHKYMETLSE